MTVETMGLIPEWTLGDRMRKAREITGLGQREFGARIGVSQQTVVNAEKGHRGVRRITMLAWAQASGVSFEWLETGIEPDDGPDGGTELPRLDSNQQPSGYRPVLVAAA